jgi:hypothetical protein
LSTARTAIHARLIVLAIKAGLVGCEAFVEVTFHARDHGPEWVTKRHAGRLAGTVEVLQKADGIPAPPKTSGVCQEEKVAVVNRFIPR